MQKTIKMLFDLYWYSCGEYDSRQELATEPHINLGFLSLFQGIFLSGRVTKYKIARLWIMKYEELEW